MKTIHYLTIIVATVLLSCSSSDSNDPDPTVIVGNVTTLAGSTYGFSDGVGADAKFLFPFGICVDNSGNLIVVDTGNNKIRKVTLAGAVTTIAGSTDGYLDEVSALARFSEPHGVCQDALGNIFVADNGNHKIRKISSVGYVTTFAGSTQGFEDGVGIAAKFYRPTAICFDSSGNMYVADSYNNTIRKITTAGVVTTFAGSSFGSSDGIGTAAKFAEPYGLCIDADDNLYVSDLINHRIRKITPSGDVSTLAGSSQGFDDGLGSEAKFDYPSGITIDPSGNLYVADRDNHKIRKISKAGVVSTIAGSDEGDIDGNGVNAKFASPYGVVYHSGKLYVSDSYTGKIKVID